MMYTNTTMSPISTRYLLVTTADPKLFALSKKHIVVSISTAADYPSDHSRGEIWLRAVFSLSFLFFFPSVFLVHAVIQCLFWMKSFKVPFPMFD